MFQIYIRSASPTDIEDILSIYHNARLYMRATGNPSQWADGYPSRSDIENDISRSISYVGVDRDGVIVLVFAFIQGEDPTYRVIENGYWLNDQPYGTIHRIASSGKYPGMLRACLDFCLTFCDNIRLDTHADNHPMQKAAQVLGFIPCGTIYCRDGSPRIAYQRPPSIN